MSHREEETPVVEETAAAAEPDLNKSVASVLKKALAHDGLCRGLHECVRAIEKDQAQLVVLAEDCNQVDYKTLVEALCAEKGIDLLSVKEAKQLGEWAGVRPAPTLPDAAQLRRLGHVSYTEAMLDSAASPHVC